MNDFHPQHLAEPAWIPLHFQEGQESQAGSVLEMTWFYFSLYVRMHDSWLQGQDGVPTTIHYVAFRTGAHP